MLSVNCNHLCILPTILGRVFVFSAMFNYLTVIYVNFNYFLINYYPVYLLPVVLSCIYWLYHFLCTIFVWSFPTSSWSINHDLNWSLCDWSVTLEVLFLLYFSWSTIIHLWFLQCYYSGIILTYELFFCMILCEIYLIHFLLELILLLILYYFPVLYYARTEYIILAVSSWCTFKVSLLMHNLWYVSVYWIQFITDFLLIWYQSKVCFSLSNSWILTIYLDLHTDLHYLWLFLLINIPIFLRDLPPPGLVHLIISFFLSFTHIISICLWPWLSMTLPLFEPCYSVALIFPLTWILYYL